MSRAEREYATSVSVNDDGFDMSLEIRVWDHSRNGGVSQELHIPVEDIPSFIEDVTRHGLHALMVAAKRLEVGHCETCGNTGLVDVLKHGRKSNEYCPDCAERQQIEPFKNAPYIGRRGVS